jgi:hypothetical protein
MLAMPDPVSVAVALYVRVVASNVGVTTGRVLSTLKTSVCVGSTTPVLIVR